MRLTVFACDGLDDVIVRGGAGAWAALLRSLSRSAFLVSASAFLAALSASMRAFTRASSSASSLFFFRKASRASCCALLTDPDDVVGFDAGADVAFCLPFAFVEGVGATATGSARIGGEGSSAPYRSFSAAAVVVGLSDGSCVVGAGVEPGMGLAPRTRRIELIKSFLVTLLLSCTWSCPFWMTTKVGISARSEKAARKPASVEPASSRKRTAF